MSRAIPEHIRREWEASGRPETDPGLREKLPYLPRLPLVIVCSYLDKEINHGNILRIAEAFRVQEVVFSPCDGCEKRYAGAVGSEKWQSHRWGHPLEEVRALRARGYSIVALHLDEQAVPLERMEWRFPVALVIGEELYGVRPDVLAECEQRVAIPLYGATTSLNVAVATGICVNAIATVYRQRVNPVFTPARAVSQKLLGFPNTEQPEGDKP
ncbi:MAG: TrmH family RNA methyltransferase [Armatimonadota bacterium]